MATGPPPRATTASEFVLPAAAAAGALVCAVSTTVGHGVWYFCRSSPQRWVERRRLCHGGDDFGEPTLVGLFLGLLAGTAAAFFVFYWYFPLNLAAESAVVMTVALSVLVCPCVLSLSFCCRSARPMLGACGMGAGRDWALGGAGREHDHVSPCCSVVLGTVLSMAATAGTTVGLGYGLGPFITPAGSDLSAPSLFTRDSVAAAAGVAPAVVVVWFLGVWIYWKCCRLTGEQKQERR